MADNENVTIRINVKADTAAIDRVQKRLAALCAQADKCNDTFDRLGKTFDDNDKRKDRDIKTTKKQTSALKDFQKATDGLGKLLKKGYSLALKGAAIETAAFALALSSVNLLLKTGQVIAKSWNATFKFVAVVAANAAAAVGVLGATFAQAMRQFAAAQSSAKYGGFVGASAALRNLQSDATLAVYGIKSLTGAFAAFSKNAKMTGASVAQLRGLSDFVVAGGDMEKGLAAAANLVSLLSSGKAAGTQEVLKAAEELGPAFSKAYKEALKGGKTTNAQMLQLFSSGALAQQAGVAGTTQTVQGTLLGQLKSFGTEIQVVFADIGARFVEPIQKALVELRRIFYRTIGSISGNLTAFAQGPFINGLIKATDKVATLLTRLFNEYLPQTTEVMGNFIAGWNRFTGAIGRGLDKFKDFLEKYSDASKEINKFFGTIFRAIGTEIKGNFGSFSELVTKNSKDFQKFGNALGELIKEIFRLFREIRESFFKALPAINAVVGAITRLVGAVASLVNILQTLGPLGGAMGLGLGMLPLGGISKKGRGRIGAMKNLAMRAPLGLGVTGAMLGAQALPGGWGDTASASILGGYLGYKGATALGALGNISAGAATGAGALAVGGVVASNAASNWAEGKWGNTAATTGVGAGTGAAFGAGAGAFIGGPVGAAIGAAIGFVIGGIIGWVNSGKAKKKAKEAGEKFGNAYADEIENLIRRGDIRGAEGAIKKFGTTLKEVTEDVNRASNMREGAEKAFQKRVEAIQPNIETFNKNLKDLEKTTGATEQEIINAAVAAEVDLSSNLLNLREIMQQTGLAVGQFGEQFDVAMNDVIGGAVAAFDAQLAILDAPKILDELAKGVQGKSAANALTDQDRAEFFRTVLTQAQTMFPGDPLAAARYYLDTVGTAGAPGYQFTTPGGRLYGLQGDVFGGGGAAIAGAGEAALATGTADIVRQNIMALVGGTGKFTVDKEQLSAALSTMGLQELLNAAEYFRTDTDLMGRFRGGATDEAQQQNINAWLSEGLAGAEIGVSKTLSNQIADGIVEGLGVLPLDPLRSAMELFNANISQLISAITGDSPSGGSSGTSSGYNPGGGDRYGGRGASTPQSGGYQYGNAQSRSPRTGGNQNGFGGGPQTPWDTATPRRNLLNTLSAHSAFNMMIAGRRTITSGLRTSNLGSMSSDHRFGYALDITGQNLGLYKAAVQRSGGLAQFHGAAGSRHLHVVPGQGPMGDSATPYMGRMGSTGTVVNSNDSYNITVNAAPGMDVKKLADEVMNRITRIQRNSAERTS